jgi:two-component system OmpR family response regulator
LSSELQQIVVRVTIPVGSNDVMSTTVPRVAVVSEDSELSEACARVLRQEGYAVQTAAHSGHALLACMEGRRVDVLIAELSMDEGSGPALARRMRRYNPNLRAIFIARPGTTAETDRVLVRPFTRDELLKRLELLPESISADSEMNDPSAYF